MDAITITIPLPPKQMHPNARSHWRAKMKPKAQQRVEAMWAGQSACGGRGKGPRWKMAEVQATWYLARQNDQDNLLAWLKGTFDGLADAGIVDNDRGFVFMPPVQVTGKAAKGERKVVLVITPRESGKHSTTL
jgi:hypothetical protein